MRDPGTRRHPGGGSLRCLIQGYRFRDAAQGAALSQRPALIDAGPRPGRSSSRNGGALTSRSDESHDAEQGDARRDRRRTRARARPGLRRRLVAKRVPPAYRPMSGGSLPPQGPTGSEAILTPITEAAIFLTLTVDAGAEDGVRRPAVGRQRAPAIGGLPDPGGRADLRGGHRRRRVGRGCSACRARPGCTRSRVRRRPAPRARDARRPALPHPRPSLRPVLRARPAADGAG